MDTPEGTAPCVSPVYVLVAYLYLQCQTIDSIYVSYAVTHPVEYVPLSVHSTVSFCGCTMGACLENLTALVIHSKQWRI